MCTPNQKTPTPGKKAAQTPSTLHRTPKSSRKRLYAEPEKVDEKVDKKATSSEHETYTPQTPYGLRTRMKQSKLPQICIVHITNHYNHPILSVFIYQILQTF